MNILRKQVLEKMYNSEIKERFIKEFYYNPDTQKAVKFTFDKTEVLEEQYNTDLSKFSHAQIVDVLRYFDSPNVNALAKYFNTLQQYAKWSSEQGYTAHNVAFFNIFRKDLRKYINEYANANQHIKDRTELYEICDKLVNPVDQALIVLIYEGILGDEMNELRYLKKEDILFIENAIFVHSGDNPRKLTNVDERTMNILKDTIEETKYYSNNGETEAKAKARQLIESDYVLKPVKMRSNIEDVITVAGINIKFMKIKKWTEKYYLNATNIFYSGIFDKLANIEKERVLNVEDYRNALKAYGVSAATYGILKERYETYKSSIG